MPVAEEIRKIVDSSGNSFHASVVRAFRDRAWYVMVSPYYLDSSSNKSREIDLIAEKAWPTVDDFGQQSGLFSVKLFVECKYITQPTVLWFDDKDVSAATKWLISNTPLRANNTYTEKHHYLSTSNKVAKLFASKNHPVVENEALHKALNQTLHAMVYLRRTGTIVPEDALRRRPHRIASEVPVIIVNSFNNFHRVDMMDTSTIQPVIGNFQLEVNYAYLDSQKNHRNEYFLVDVVALDSLDEFFRLLEADSEAMSASL